MKALAIDLFDFDFAQSSLKQWLGQLLSFLGILLFLTTISYLLLDGSKGVQDLQATDKRPNQKIIIKSDSYRFRDVNDRFGSVNIAKIDGLSKQEVHALILSSIPTKLSRRFKKFLPATLRISEKYKVDPFWVIAVMWTESHFNVEASSRVNAKGLMQIMPKTGAYLSRKLKRRVPHNVTHNLIKDPYFNIELGVFYLKKLLSRFDNNFKLATVAYNMGPGWVTKRLKLGRPVGVKNNYFDKVNRAYISLAGQVEGHLMFLPMPYRKTYVAKEPLISDRTPGKNVLDQDLIAWVNQMNSKKIEHATF